MTQTQPSAGAVFPNLSLFLTKFVTYLKEQEALQGVFFFIVCM